MAKTFTGALRLCCTALLAGVLLVGAGSALADPPQKDSHSADRGRGDHGDRGNRRDQGKHADRGNQRQRSDQGDRVVRWDGDRRGDNRDGRRDRVEYRERGDRGDRGEGRKHSDQGDRVVRRDGDRYEGHGDGHRDRDRYYAPPKYYGDHHHHETTVIYRPYAPSGHYRKRWYRDVLVVRPYGHWYPGYAYYEQDDDAYKWLAFTAIALKLLDNLNEQQQREHEAAQVAATTAPIGERIVWQDGGAYGAVTPTRDGTSTTGRYCREFLQEVSIGGRTEQAYGTACRQPDGAWEMVSVD